VLAHQHPVIVASSSSSTGAKEIREVTKGPQEGQCTQGTCPALSYMCWLINTLCC
jgi:hypothetical protein